MKDISFQANWLVHDRTLREQGVDDTQMVVLRYVYLLIFSITTAICHDFHSFLLDFCFEMEIFVFYVLNMLPYQLPCGPFTLEYHHKFTFIIWYFQSKVYV